MKTQEFFKILDAHKDKSLLFEYAPNLLVGANLVFKFESLLCWLTFLKH
tara:strand:+ start:2783 stop:2929 length:147 start_codon:yes stop_codon:yes gene_type:complete